MWGLKRGGGVYTQLSHIHIQFRVIVLQVVRRLYYRSGAMPRTTFERSGAIVWYRHQDYLGVVQATLFFREGKEIGWYPRGTVFFSYFIPTLCAI